jgi:hypothetical protein
VRLWLFPNPLHKRLSRAYMAVTKPAGRSLLNGSAGRLPDRPGTRSTSARTWRDWAESASHRR